MSLEDKKEKEKPSSEELQQDFEFTMELIGMRQKTISELLENIRQNHDPADLSNLSRELWGEVEAMEELTKHAYELAQKRLRSLL
jgi:hypothetical protein